MLKGNMLCHNLQEILQVNKKETTVVTFSEIKRVFFPTHTYTRVQRFVSYLRHRAPSSSNRLCLNCRRCFRELVRVIFNTT